MNDSLTLTSTLLAGTAALTLMWNPNQEPDLQGYNVYRGTQSGQYQMIATTTDTSYVDSVDSGNVYYYAITAFDTAGNESDYSNEVSWNDTTTTYRFSGSDLQTLNNGFGVRGDTLVFWGHVDTMIVAKTRTTFAPGLYRVTALLMPYMMKRSQVNANLWPMARFRFGVSDSGDVEIRDIIEHQVFLENVDFKSLEVIYVNDAWIPDSLDINFALIGMNVDMLDSAAIVKPLWPRNINFAGKSYGDTLIINKNDTLSLSFDVWAMLEDSTTVDSNEITFDVYIKRILDDQDKWQGLFEIDPTIGQHVFQDESFIVSMNTYYELTITTMYKQAESRIPQSIYFIVKQEKPSIEFWQRHINLPIHIKTWPDTSSIPP